MRLAPIQIVKGEFGQPDPGDVLITLNIKAADLSYLTSKRYGYQYFSKDEKAIPDPPEGREQTSTAEGDLDTLLEVYDQDDLGEEGNKNIAISVRGEAVKQSVSAAYKMAKLTVPRRFTSMAARIHGFPATNAYLAPYGDVVVVVEPKEVRDHLVVFSGDVKTLGDALLRGQAKQAKAWRIEKQVGTLAKRLSMYRERSKISGRYFEARLSRPLKVTDINKIYIPAHNDDAARAAEKINTLKLQKAKDKKRHQFRQNDRLRTRE